MSRGKSPATGSAFVKGGFDELPDRKLEGRSLLSAQYNSDEGVQLTYGGAEAPCRLLSHSFLLAPDGKSLQRAEGISLLDAFKAVKSNQDDDSEIVGGVKLGLFTGVFVRCLLNIWGVLMFLRLAWIVAYAGISYSLLIVICCGCVSLPTASSLSAICTNGEVKGGGLYFLISRSLGPDYGGTIGVMYSLATAAVVALHLLGFAEIVKAELLRDPIFGDGSWDPQMIALISLVALAAIVVCGGLAVAAKTQLLLLVLLCAALLSSVAGSFQPPQESLGFTGWTKDTFRENLNPEWKEQSFMTLFGIFFPAATGIMAGANISGDLINPTKDIPRGTFLAVVVALGVYIMLIVVVGCTCRRDCGADCGLFDYSIMVETALVSELIIAGTIAAGLSSALAAFDGAPRVLNAVSQDYIFAPLAFFAKDPPNKEPYRGYALVFIIAASVSMTGRLNTIAPFITLVFLISYAMVNYACFAAEHSRAPGWRPSFKYYNKWLSLACSILCIILMFAISWPVSIGVVACAYSLYYYVKYYTMPTMGIDWGCANEAREYVDAIRFNYHLELIHAHQSQEHVKTYRPSLLVLPKDINSEHSTLLYRFARKLTAASKGILVVGNVLEGKWEDKVGELPQHLHSKILLNQQPPIKGFVSTVIAPDKTAGFRILMHTSGVGWVRPNTVLLKLDNFPKYQKGSESQFEPAQLIQTIQDARKSVLDVVLVRNVSAAMLPGQSRDYNNKLSAKASKKASRRGRPGRIDVWWLENDGGLTLLLPLLLSKKTNGGWKNTTLRVLTLTTSPDATDTELAEEMALLKENLTRFRVDATVQVLKKPSTSKAVRTVPSLWQSLNLPAECSDFDQTAQEFSLLGDLVRQWSGDADLVCMTLPIPPQVVHPLRYLGWLDVATRRSPPLPLMFIRGSRQVLTAST
eukprot:gb/GEZN01001696.1/.p1 GENE.gb/GEZN01001696.1/~~gb/GEZN01001696.1/.p1  ORF type:complete len:926 (-),score=89.20 gb/GEZN01001696.1/:99-2855(-)